VLPGSRVVSPLVRRGHALPSLLGLRFSRRRLAPRSVACDRWQDFSSLPASSDMLSSAEDVLHGGDRVPSTPKRAGVLVHGRACRSLTFHVAGGCLSSRSTSRSSAGFVWRARKAHVTTRPGQERSRHAPTWEMETDRSGMPSVVPAARPCWTGGPVLFARVFFGAPERSVVVVPPYSSLSNATAVTFGRGPSCGCRLRGPVSRGVALCGSPVKAPASSPSPLLPRDPLPWRVPVELHRTPSPRREAGADAGPVSDSLARSLPRVPPLSLPFGQERMLTPFGAAFRLSPGALAPASDRASGLLRPCEGRRLLGGRRGFTPWP
jgi:hypothetical protein